MGFLKSLFGRRSSSAEDFFNRGNDHSIRDEHDQAIAAFTEAIRLEPTNCSGAYSGRAKAYFAKNQYDQAIADCTDALRLNPQNEGALFVRGFSYSNTQQPIKAIPDFTQIIRLAPGHAGAYHLRGICHANLGDDERAITDFVEVARLCPYLLTSSSEPEWLLGLFAKAEKRFEESKADGDSQTNPGRTTPRS